MPGVEVPGSQVRRPGGSEGDPKPEALPQAGPGGGQNIGASAEPGEALWQMITVLSLSLPFSIFSAHQQRLGY